MVPTACVSCVNDEVRWRDELGKITISGRNRDHGVSRKTYAESSFEDELVLLNGELGFNDLSREELDFFGELRSRREGTLDH